MIAYFIAVSVCWVACLALYAGLLRGEKFFHLNRVYLLLTLALGLLIPLIDWFPATGSPQTGWISQVIWLPEVTVSDISPKNWPVGEKISFADILLGIYLTGCAIMTARLLRYLWQLAALIRSGVKTREKGFTLVETDRVSTPFSFLGYLFWNPALDFDPETARTVRTHEEAHIRQGHSMDLLALELIGIFAWWCPFWYAYNRALRNVHEYLADSAAIRQISTRDYGQLLIRQCLSHPAPALAHGLPHHSQLKNRIAMMTKSNSSRLAVAKYFTLLPLTALLSVACAQTEPMDMVVHTPPAMNQPVSQLIDTVITYDPATYVETMEVFKTDIYAQVEQMPVFGSCPDLKGDALANCSNGNLMQFIVSQMRYPKEAKKAGVQGMVVASFIVLKSGQVGNIQIKKSVSTECDAEVRRLISEMPAWQPGTIEGKPVAVEMSLPIKFKLD
ncbi:MAG: M56 family metallopeptidase [Saprospirales bacterium]|nr:M56 family metallopeptidase [Saprospirales bacterium]